MISSHHSGELILAHALDGVSELPNAREKWMGMEVCGIYEVNLCITNRSGTFLTVQKASKIVSKIVDSDDPCHTSL